MKKVISLIILFATVFTLASCGKDDGIPDGMQLVRGGDDIGYYFYAPEEWTVSNLGDISVAYASSVDTTSVTYVETDMPDKTVKEYFDSSLTEFPDAPKIITDAEAITFGNADDAVKFVYEHEYTGHKFRTMQIFTRYGERFGIFTYTAVLENKSASDKTQYDFYLEKIQAVIDNFKFTKKSVSSTEKTDTDVDGYRLVSNKSISKFSLYVPEEFEVEYSSGIVCAKLSDNSNITMTRAMATGMSITDYWNTRKAELSEIVTDLNVFINEDRLDMTDKEATIVQFGNAKNAAAYEYTYVYNGTTYHVYQVFGVTTFNGFTLTYTATEENYAKHIETVKKIVEKVEF